MVRWKLFSKWIIYFILENICAIFIGQEPRAFKEKNIHFKVENHIKTIKLLMLISTRENCKSEIDPKTQWEREAGLIAYYSWHCLLIATVLSCDLLWLCVLSLSDHSALDPLLYPCFDIGYSMSAGGAR